jgi:hypothetical protein
VPWPRRSLRRAVPQDPFSFLHHAGLLACRVGEDVTTLAPHRPERALLTHSVPRARASLAMSWILRCILCHRHSLTKVFFLVSLAIHVVSWTRFAGYLSHPLFPDMVLSTRRFPSLLRVPPSVVPRSHRYYESATTSYWRISGRLFCSLPPSTCSSLSLCSPKRS